MQFLLAHLAGLPADSWVVRAEIDNLPVSTQYMASVFHTISQMLAVSSGLAPPARNSEYITFIMCAWNRDCRGACRSRERAKAVANGSWKASS